MGRHVLFQAHSNDLCQYWLKCFGYDMLVRQLHCESWLLGFASN